MPVQWDENNKTDRLSWASQHSELKMLDPPYVYNIHKQDKDAFVNAIFNATRNPIKRYVADCWLKEFSVLSAGYRCIPADMKASAVATRLGAILARDWRAEAEAIIEERQRTGSGKVDIS